MSELRSPERPILLVDDDPTWTRSLMLNLERLAGYNHFVACNDSSKVMGLLARQEFSLVLLDMTMPPPTGEDLLPLLREAAPETPVIMVTGISQLESAVTCMRLGAFDYFVKSQEESRLVTSMHLALHQRELEGVQRSLQERFFHRRVDNPEAFHDMHGDSPCMQQGFSYLEAVAPSHQPILITGESGTGKELAARALHRISRPGGPWVAINVAGLDDNVFSDTLFGHVPGAFTGADKPRRGMIETAGGGTLFLDEIGDLSHASQVKLLRLLQEGEFYPLGSDKPQRSSARIVVATNVDLGEAVQQERFRRDLYYRLKSHHVHLPPLRERSEDLSLLLESFLSQAAEELDRPCPTPPPELLSLLKTYHFPGNIRELQGMVYEAVSLHQRGKMGMGSFLQAMGLDPDAAYAQPPSAENSPVTFGERLPTLEEVGELLVEEAMLRSDGNQSLAARLLGISRQGLAKRLKKTT